MLRGLAVFPTSTPATTSTTPGEAIPLQARPFHSFFSEHAPDLLRGAYSHASRSIFAGNGMAGRAEVVIALFLFFSIVGLLFLLFSVVAACERSPLGMKRNE
uniref:Uncharacterized protein n=2 Tax=Physcomitrium patens TaxID=3218 RepID=A0A7I4BHH9_PHYPA